MSVHDRPEPRTIKELNDTYLRYRIFATIVVLIVLAVALYGFMRQNENRVISVNNWYVESTTTQTANLVSEMMDSGLDSITMLATIYQGQDLSQEAQRLDEITADTTFDEIGYCDAQGQAFGPEGLTFDAQRQPYFARGMAGERGIEPMRSHGTGELRLVAYAPIYDDAGAPMGVLVGTYANNRLASLITESFFDEPVRSYLCAQDGTIVARSVGATTGVDNMFQFYDAEDQASARAMVRFAFEQNRDATFTFDSPDGTGVAYVATLADHSLLMVSILPSSAIAALTGEANAAGFTLMTVTAILFVLYIAVLIWQNYQQNRRLTVENRQLDRMVASVTNLFQRFVVVDLPTNSYSYIKKDGPFRDIPIQGSYEDYYGFWVGHLDPRDRGVMRRFISPEGITERLRQHGEPFIQQNFRLLDDDGHVIWASMSILPVTYDEEGNPMTLLIAVQDISETMEQQERQRKALQEAFSAAEQASAAKTDFLNAMSHDIRTPMNSIMGLTAIAAMHVDDKHRVEDCLEKIGGTSRHLLNLLNEVLDMAKIESGNLDLAEDDVDLPELVDDLLAIIHPAADAKGLELKTNIAEVQHEHVQGDPMRLQQILVNVMDNAVKFTPAGGSVTLAIRELPGQVNGSGRFVFTVTDTGCGMSPEFLERVFEPFARGHDTRTSRTEGTGLGMAIVRNLVELMNGTVEVSSEEGVGTTVTVDIYLRIREAAAVDVSGLKGMRVLVVDDDEVACEATTAMLTGLQMEGEWVLGGREALALVTEAREEGHDFTAVILDWRMPGMSGIECARAIRRSVGEGIPIIILSAYDWSAIEQEARDVGVNAFISKPIFKSKLVQVLSDVLLDAPGEGGSDVLDDLQQQDFTGRRVLLVEDTPMAAAIAEEILRVTGVDVEHAENGKDAVDLVAHMPEKYFDLVFMDIQMPVMNGYEATREIRSLGARGRADLTRLPIIALSADAFADDVRRATDAGMNAHMAKPMEISVLITTLNQWLQ